MSEFTSSALLVSSQITDSKPQPKPQHVAIILDGNGRWAKLKNLSLIQGHHKGAESAKKIILYALKIKIPYLTLYVFSSENWKRDPSWVIDFLRLVKLYLKRDIKEFTEHNIQIRFIGDLTTFSQEIIDLTNSIELATKNNSALTVSIALGYSGRDEIIRALVKMKDLFKQKEFIPTQECFSKYLDTKDIPDPDLLIRTSGEQRLSNFMLWQLAYSELYFTDTLWPDFTEDDFDKAIEVFQKRSRRYGRN
jgi:undecaprenyl diphosphate synthase